MALTSLPLTDSFALAWEFDDAFDRDREDFDHAYQVAVETLDFASLCKPGEKPTLFRFRPMSGERARAFQDLELGQAQKLALAFRMMLVKIENFDAPELPPLEPKVDPQYKQLGKLVNPALVDYLDALAVAAGQPFGSIVTSLGALAALRSLGLGKR